MGRPDLAADPRFSTAAGRRKADVALDALVSDWTRTLDPDAVMTKLQAAGVPAGRMLRVAELPDFAPFAERGFFRVEQTPYLPAAPLVEARHVKTSAWADPPLRPAPLMGEQTEEVMHDWLGLDDAEIARLVAEGVLEPTSQKIRAMIEDGSGLKETRR
jgi:crotonobetainyl-CoA:carnitine CoA-transferase CaiB-like acyl-CoA transferase